MLDKILLRIAKTAILAHFDSQYKIDKESLIGQYPYLATNCATFVTLHYDHELRGCIGSLLARRALIDDILGNALSAAFHDPRFRALHVSEFSQLFLEVSLLSTPEILEYKDFNDLLKKVKPFVDGLILVHNNYQGTFLPQVWEQLPSPEQFLEHLSYKAGADPLIYKEHPTIYRYRVDSLEERFDAILPL